MFSRVFSPVALENLEEITDNFEETINFEKKIYKKIRSRQWAEVVNIYREHFDQAHKVMAMLRETVVHLAIAHGSEDIVEELVKIIDDNKDRFKNVLQYKNDQGDTPLHVAASTGSLSTCVCIAEADPSMGNERNKEGKSPLFLAALLGRTEIFFHLHSICESHLDTSYYRKEDDLAYRILLLHGELATCVDENGILPIHLLAEKPSAFRSGCHLGWWSIIIYHWTPVDVPKKIDKSLTRPLNKRREQKFPENHQTCVSFIQLLWRWTIIQVGEIKKIKETHRLSVKIMKLCIKPISVEHYFDGGTNPWLTRYEDEDLSFIAAYRAIVSEYDIHPQEEKETPILSAAENGIKEMVIGILHKFPMAIHDETRDGKNIVLLAAKYRRTQVYELFRKLKAIYGLKHIMNSMPQGFLHLSNNAGKTPGEIFMEKHKTLVKKGGKWLIETSNACSIVAGLFVTVAFNMSTTVPGDVDDNGYPRLEKELAFNMFAISSYVSFYSSLLAVIMFLAILTSGYKESSFRSTLPMKLLLALTAFYVSIASTAICFSAAHFFILR
uniref:PGG domain-containing protein n=1 Tax=Quercus lobata TaxID=97700 RepID=A0A7N2N6T5_QUELO